MINWVGMAGFMIGARREHEPIAQDEVNTSFVMHSILVEQYKTKVL
jgi:hypothetical protein